MIKFLQSGNRAAKYILAGFLLILAASMVTYLIPGFAGDTSASETGVVASVGGHEIHREEVARVVQAQARGNQIPDFYMPIMRQQAIKQLIQQAELQYESERMGLKVSDQEFRDELQYGPYKQAFFPAGKWIGSEKYKQLLTQGGTTVENFERDVRLDLLQRKLVNVIGARATATDSDVEQAYKDQNTKVKFQYAVLKLDDVAKAIKPTDTELKAFYSANQARYTGAIPEKRQIRYFVLNEKNVADKVTVDPAEIQRAYSAGQAAYRIPERVKVRHILIEMPKPGPDGKVDPKAVDAARAKAEDVLKQIKATGDWAGLAKKYSGDPGSKDKGGELDWLSRGQTVAEFDKVAFAQNKGQISDPVQSSFGFHIIQTEEKEDAHLKPLDEVKAGIEGAIKAEKIKAAMTQASTDAESIAQKQGLDKAASKYGAQVVSSNMITRNDALPGIGPQPPLMDAIFSTKEKAGPQATQTPQSTVVFDVSKIEPARTPSFDEIKDRVATEFKNQRAADILRRKAQELADRAHAEHDLGKAAKEAGATVKTSDLVSRTQQVPDIGSLSGPANAAFTMKQGEISGPLNLGTSQAVLQILERREPSPTDADFAKQRDQLRERLASQKRQEVLTLFVTDLNTRLEKEGKVKINKTEMDNLTKSRS
ncbi:MAG TPA: peptidyl-prolyl cis-trans isomerase [Candidatus Angelobacter sp.]|jgi:peptidyl-prolyl cis-trans isomerase D|nr:peptidyl-prolyl cis-trans isomerase [Candidatus Angelobacter sp.]